MFCQMLLKLLILKCLLLCSHAETVHQDPLGTIHGFSKAWKLNNLINNLQTQRQKLWENTKFHVFKTFDFAILGVRFCPTICIISLKMIKPNNPRFHNPWILLNLVRNGCPTFKLSNWSQIIYHSRTFNLRWTNSMTDANLKKLEFQQ